jgi:hypothetical protein
MLASHYTIENPDGSLLFRSKITEDVEDKLSIFAPFSGYTDIHALFFNNMGEKILRFIIFMVITLVVGLLAKLQTKIKHSKTML